jgi:hypothetical protein
VDLYCYAIWLWVDVANVLALKLEAACSSEMLAALPTTTQSNNPRTELTPRKCFFIFI